MRALLQPSIAARPVTKQSLDTIINLSDCARPF